MPHEVVKRYVRERERRRRARRTLQRFALLALFALTGCCDSCTRMTTQDDIRKAEACIKHSQCVLNKNEFTFYLSNKRHELMCSARD